MPRDFHVAESIANAQAELATRCANGGYLRIYDDATMLVEVPLADPAYGAAAGGVAIARPTPLVMIARSGRATHFRVYRADGMTPCWRGSVGQVDSDLNLTTVRLDAGVQFQLDGLSFSAGPI